MRRAVTIALCCAVATPAVAAAAPRFDLQAHRGGAGLVSESTLEAYANALRIGVTTLELDVRLTEDGRPLVTHDRRISARKCRDTAPAAPGDKEFPYAGDLVRRLSAAQVATLDCGWRRPPEFPRQRVASGARMPLLGEVLALARCRGAERVRFAVDPKFAAGAPGETAPRRQLAHVVVRAIRHAGMAGRVTIHGFDWHILRRMRRLEPRLEIVAAWSERTLQAGRPGASPWLGGLDVDDFGGDAVAAAAALGVDGVAPGERRTTRRLVRRAHGAGLTVVPWTVDEPARMGALIGAGVDGMITDYPDRLRGVMARRGLATPTGGRACLGPPMIATW